MECDDPWVQELAVMASNDADYMNMVSHIELGTKMNNLPQEYELSQMGSKIWVPLQNNIRLRRWTEGRFY